MCDESLNGPDGCRGHEHGETPPSGGDFPGARLHVGNGQVFQLVRGLPPKRLANELHYYRRLEDVSRYATGLYLLDMHERREHETFGQPSTDDWAEANLDMEPRTARERRQVLRACQHLPLVHEAVKRGTLSYSRARLIVRVATPETEKAWLALARTKTVRKLAREVKGKKKGSKPTKGKLGTPCPTGLLRYQVSMAVKRLWDDYMERCLAALGPEATPADVIELLAKGEVPGGDPVNAASFVFHGDPSGDCWVNAKEGRVPVPLLKALELSGYRVVVLPDPPEGEYPAIGFGERGSVPPEERDDPTPPAIREAVFKRDGHRCVLCGSRNHLRGHHLKSRADGGETRIEWIVTLCLGCHSLCHAGLLTLCIDAEGTAYAKDRWGRRLDEGISPAEALRDAPPGRELAVIECAEDGGARAPEAPVEEGVDENGARTPFSVVGVKDELSSASDDAARGARAPQESEVVAPAPSRREFLRAVHSAQSIERIPSRLTRDEWHALSGRLEWSRGRGELVFRPEWEAAPPREPPAPLERESGRKLSQLIGQDRVRKSLGDLVHASRSLAEPLPSLLFEGPPGLGKSSFARAMAEELGVRIQVVTGSNLKDAKEAMSLLAGLGRGDILFIDEIHAVDKKVLECFYPALEERVFQWTVHEGPRSRSLEVELEPFAFMGATTEEGMLPEPLRSRFAQVVRLERYSDPEIEEIANSIASALSTSISPEASRELARRARGTPRIVRNLVLSVRAHAVAKGRPGIDLASVLETMEAQGIDQEGLGRPEREILRYLLEVGRPIGLKAVAAALRMDVRTIERVHEPYLIEKGFIIRTMRGRVATVKARMHIARTSAA